MKNYFKKHWALIVAVILIGLGDLPFKGCGHKDKSDNTRVKIDSTVYVDTIPYLVPVPKDSVVLRYDTRKVPLADVKTAYDSATGDSVVIVGNIPVTQNVYRDSSYIAWVSGYRPSLDSIRVFSRTRYVTKIITEKSEPPESKRLNFGLQAGYGITPKGIQPYIGIGLGFRF